MLSTVVPASRFPNLGILSALLAFLLPGPALRAQRPVQDDDILQYLSQTITWYRGMTAAVQSSADARETIYADSLRQSSAETVRLA